METKMRKMSLMILGVLAISACAIQASTAAPHNSKAAAHSSSAAHQFRKAFGSAEKTTGTRSCDIIWCYED
jgi:hypothetical protein